MSHTAGPWKPWKVDHRIGVKDIYEIHWSDQGECVAEVVHGQADAHLIAAAPDLLAALEYLRDNVVAYGESPADPEIQEAIQMANTAIRKAKRETL